MRKTTLRNAAPSTSLSSMAMTPAGPTGKEVSRLASVRQSVGRTQAQVAHDLGIRQNNVSRLEARSDMRCSTLRGYLASLGADLEIYARLDGRLVLLDLPGEAAIGEKA